MKKSLIRYGYPIALNTKKLPASWFELGRQIANQNPVIPDKERVTRGLFLTCLSPNSHKDAFKYAIDFLVPDGTGIIAGAEGFIDATVDFQHEWGPSRNFAGKLNYITLRHSFGGQIEYSQYCHLAQNSTIKLGLGKGDFVKRGQLIGYVGKTGWTDRDHLHFMVFKSIHEDPGYESVPARFRIPGPLSLIKRIFNNL